VLSRPPGISDEALMRALRTHWDVGVAALQYRPVGFGSHHWDARDAIGRSWFVTVDDVGREPTRLRAALGTALSLHAAGCAFVVGPVATNAGEPLAMLGEFAVALYPRVDGEHFVGGEFATHGHRRAVLNLVIELHRQPRASAPDAFADDFTIPRRGDLEAGLAGHPGDGAGPYAGPVANLLDREGAVVHAALAHYDRLAARVDGCARPRVITHGEPHAANTIATADGLVLVDWDTVLVAPPERDLWGLDAGDGENLRAYAAATGTEPSPDALALYRLRWDLNDIAVYVHRLRQPHEGNADDEKSWLGLASTVARLATEAPRWS
jgi:hypothetical protein